MSALPERKDGDLKSVAKYFDENLQRENYAVLKINQAEFEGE